MSKRKIPFVRGEYYHIYNRGNSKQKIFLDKSDYRHFIKCLFICNTKNNFKFRDNIVDLKIDAFEFEREKRIVSIGAWVLMPNHFHIYITINPHMSDMWERDERNSISEFMRKLLTAYVKYFNSKYNRTGGLFEGKFKSVHISSDNQAKYLFSYIHLNPIKLIQKDWKEVEISDIQKSLEFLYNYKWSSYYDYMNTKRKENKILDLNDFPKYFNNIKDFNKEILEWLKFKDE
jgi:REP element-mobilizing transposase RayT